MSSKTQVIKRVLKPTDELTDARRLATEAKVAEIRQGRLTSAQSEINSMMDEYVAMGGPQLSEEQWLKQMAEDPDGMAADMANRTQHVPRIESSRHVEIGSLEAEARLANGEHPARVFQETGWYRVPDGPKDRRMRFYLPDADASVDGTALRRGVEAAGIPVGKNGSVTMTVGDVLKHDDLYEVYPELRDVELVVSVRHNQDGTMKIFDPYKGGITAQQGVRKNGDYWVGVYNDVDGDLGRKALIHEINHVVQRLEGWSKGSSSKHWEELIFPAQRAYLDMQIGDDMLNMRFDPDDLTDVMRYAEEFAAKNPAINVDTAEGIIAELMHEGNLEEYLGLSEAVYNKSLRDLSLFLKQVGNAEPENVDKFLQNAPPSVAFGLTRSRYLRTLGEAESRVRERLIDMTKEELRKMDRTPIQTVEDEGLVVDELIP